MKNQNWIQIIGLICLFFAVAGLDQSTKLHVQDRFMTWSHPTQVLGYRADRVRLATLGLSPSLLQEQGLPTNLRGSSWGDLNLTYVRNPGAAWGTLLHLSNDKRRALFYGVTVLATLAIAYLLFNSSPSQKVLRLGLCFLLAGAAGNFVDRLLLGYVIDWVHLQWRIRSWQVSFPVFNVADVAVHFGFVAILLDVLAVGHRKDRDV